MSTTYSPEEVIAAYAAAHPGAEVVSVEFDSMAAFAGGEPWFVFVVPEDAAPDRIVLPYRD